MTTEQKNEEIAKMLNWPKLTQPIGYDIYKGNVSWTDYKDFATKGGAKECLLPLPIEKYVEYENSTKREFHSDRNFLHLAIQRIEDIDMGVFGYNVALLTECRGMRTYILTFPITIPTDVLFDKVAEFAKFYNDNKK